MSLALSDLEERVQVWEIDRPDFESNFYHIFFNNFSKPRLSHL